VIEKVKTYAIVLLIAVAVVAVLWGWYKPSQNVQPAKTYTEAPKEKIVEKIKTVMVPGPERIVTIEKETAAKKLELPEWVKGPDKQIIANAEIQPYEGKQSALAVLDTKTGEGSIIVKPLSRSLFQFQNRKEIGLRYGVSSAAGQGAEMYGRWTFVRVGAFKGALYGEINNRPEGKAMLDVRYEW
jgi:hypothetical protein